MAIGQLTTNQLVDRAAFYATHPPLDGENALNALMVELVSRGESEEIRGALDNIAIAFQNLNDPDYFPPPQPYVQMQMIPDFIPPQQNLQHVLGGELDIENQAELLRQFQRNRPHQAPEHRPAIPPQQNHGQPPVVSRQISAVVQTPQNADPDLLTRICSAVGWTLEMFVSLFFTSLSSLLSRLESTTVPIAAAEINRAAGVNDQEVGANNQEVAANNQEVAENDQEVADNNENQEVHAAEFEEQEQAEVRDPDDFAQDLFVRVWDHFQNNGEIDGLEALIQQATESDLNEFPRIEFINPFAINDLGDGTHNVRIQRLNQHAFMNPRRMNGALLSKDGSAHLIVINARVQNVSTYCYFGPENAMMITNSQPDFVAYLNEHVQQPYTFQAMTVEPLA